MDTSSTLANRVLLTRKRDKQLMWWIAASSSSSSSCCCRRWRRRDAMTQTTMNFLLACRWQGRPSWHVICRQLRVVDRRTSGELTLPGGRVPQLYEIHTHKKWTATVEDAHQGAAVSRWCIASLEKLSQAFLNFSKIILKTIRFVCLCVCLCVRARARVCVRMHVLCHTYKLC